MPGKVSIIGAGNVGTASAFALAIDGTPDEVVLFDCNLQKAEGEIMDIEHANSFLPYTDFCATESYTDTAGSDVVVITAGAKQSEGKTRLDLIDKNLDILASIVSQVLEHSPDAILLLVSNPVDVLTYFAQHMTGLSRDRVFGTGTVLDTARYESFIAKELKLNPQNVHAYVMGEHGDSSVAALSTATVGAIPLENMPGYDTTHMLGLHKEVVQAAYEVIERKGATNLAIGLCVQRILHAILNNTHEMLPVSTVLEGEYGIEGVAMSTPCMIGRAGIEKRFELPLTSEEKSRLDASATTLKEVIDEQSEKERDHSAWCPL